MSFPPVCVKRWVFKCRFRENHLLHASLTTGASPMRVLRWLSILSVTENLLLNAWQTCDFSYVCIWRYLSYELFLGNPFFSHTHWILFFFFFFFLNIKCYDTINLNKILIDDLTFSILRILMTGDNWKTCNKGNNGKKLKCLRPRTASACNFWKFFRDFLFINAIKIEIVKSSMSILFRLIVS